MDRPTVHELVKSSRFASLRVVDHIHTDPGRGRLYEVVDDQEEGAGKSRRTACRTRRCRDFALRVYDVTYRADTYGIDPYVLRQSQGLSLQHPNLLTFYDIELLFGTECRDVVTPECQTAYLLLLTELASGNLKDWLEVRRKRAPYGKLLQLACDTVRGVAFLHAHGFVHRRLHPGNILLVETPADPSKQNQGDNRTAKLGDFQDLASYCPKALPLRDEHSPYTSPELLYGYSTYSPSSDMWSVGIVLFELLLGLGRTPFLDAAHDTRWFKSNQRKYVLSRIFQWLGTPDKAWRETYAGETDATEEAQVGGGFLARLPEFFP